MLSWTDWLEIAAEVHYSFKYKPLQSYCCCRYLESRWKNKNGKVSLLVLFLYTYHLSRQTATPSMEAPMRRPNTTPMLTTITTPASVHKHEQRSAEYIITAHISQIWYHTKTICYGWFTGNIKQNQHCGFIYVFIHTRSFLRISAFKLRPFVCLWIYSFYLFILTMAASLFFFLSHQMHS